MFSTNLEWEETLRKDLCSVKVALPRLAQELNTWGISQWLSPEASPFHSDSSPVHSPSTIRLPLTINSWRESIRGCSCFLSLWSWKSHPLSASVSLIVKWGWWWQYQPHEAGTRIRWDDSEPLAYTAKAHTGVCW